MTDIQYNILYIIFINSITQILMFYKSTLLITSTNIMKLNIIIYLVIFISHLYCYRN